MSAAWSILLPLRAQRRLSCELARTAFTSIRMNPVNRHMSTSAFRARSASFGSRRFCSPGIAEFRYMSSAKSNAWSPSTKRR
jgi:hypothetical protein